MVVTECCLERRDGSRYTKLPALGTNFREKASIGGMDGLMPNSKTSSTLLVTLALAVVSAYGQDMGALQKKLVSEFALTQPTADNTDIVTAGAILVLQKSDLVLGPTA